MRWFIAIALSVSAATAALAETPGPYQTVTVVLGGDIGLGASGERVEAGHAVRQGQRTAVADMARGIAPLLKGDVVFANLETVVTERNDLGAVEKSFNFRSHPSGVRELVKLGFNVFSTANNHANDYGAQGIADTVRHLEALRADGLKGAPGTGFGRAAALAPVTITLPQGRVLISAAGIGGPGTGGGAAKPAMAPFHNDADFREQGFDLRDTEGDIRILSVHFGIERSVRPSSTDERKLRAAAESFDIDLIAGHHAHVAAGVQDLDERFIFYGLGNLMHPGMQDMDKFGICRDFGVVARVHFGRAAPHRYGVRAIEVMTLDNMQAAPRVRTGEDGRTRIAALNHLAAGLDDPGGGARGVRFTPQADGSGLYCTARAADKDDAVAQRCRVSADMAIPPPPSSVAASCGRNEPAVATGDDGAEPRSARRTTGAAKGSGAAAGDVVDATRLY